MFIALGETIFDLSKTNNKGTVVFFPSYFLLHKCQKIWNLKEIMKKFEKNKASVIIDNSKQKFLANSLKNNKDKNYKFFSVCRGSSSEGIDFKDDDARMIIYFGIPYRQFIRR